MSINIEFDWLDPGSRDCPANDATFASLRIGVQDEIITRVLDRRSNSIRPRILVPLYLMAEWLVANWWPLQEESEVPGRSHYAERHCLLFGREGYAFPDLRIVPEARRTRIEWHARETVYQSVSFISHGQAQVDALRLQQALSDFVLAVVERLRAQGIEDTWLQNEWAAVQDTMASSEETEFCRAMAWLGCDPYDMGDQAADAVCACLGQLPEHLREETLRCTEPSGLSAVVDWIKNGLSGKVPDIRPQVGPPEVRRGLLGNVDLAKLPWEEGYRLARECRTVLKWDGRLPVPLEEVFDGTLPIQLVHEAPLNVDALLISKGGAICYTAKKRPESQRFVFARGLLEYLYGSSPATLLSSARTEHQKRNRAFAAELLAPAEAIKQRLRHDTVASEEIIDLADEFLVSSYVVEHQIRNHRLASLVIEDA